MSKWKLSVACLKRIVNRVERRWYCSQRKVTNSEVRQKRNELFNKEMERQLGLITRIEKIEVEHRGPPEECTLIMNKGLSTPYNCAMHIQEHVMNQSVLARVNGQLWDMHHPLTEDCELEFLHFKDEDPSASNAAFWNSCSFLLGHILETAFKDEFYVQLCNFPPLDISRGCFAYDAEFGFPFDWDPSPVALQCLSRVVGKLSYEDLKFKRLDVDASLALEMFADNKYKAEQISKIAASSKSGSTVSLYRVKDHIDLSTGPMISNTSQIGRFNVAAIHNIESSEYGELQRVQGVALPKQLPLHYWTYERLIDRAREKVLVDVTSQMIEEIDKQSTSKEIK